MKLERNKKYKHTTGSGITEMIYSHSDNLDHNHFFTVTKNPKNWKLDENNQVSLPTWDLHRNVTMA